MLKAKNMYGQQLLKKKKKKSKRRETPSRHYVRGF